eukprot:g1774.t1
MTACHAALPSDELHLASAYNVLLSPSSGRVRVLTVGDGDLTYSVALARAYGSRIALTATTFVDADELVRTYELAAGCLEELAARGQQVRHGIDATTLEAADPPLGTAFDHIVFNHPHLGLGDLKDTEAHSKRHSVLVAHYFASARALLAPAGQIHLTLSTSTSFVWSCHSELGPWTGYLGQPFAVRSKKWAARRRFRGGALGSKHWLGQYGYEHRRTAGDIDMRVDKSVELVRNALFRHLQESCDPTAGHAPGKGKRGSKIRIALLLGYVGRPGGCSFNGDEQERQRPTIEGEVLAAACRAWGEGAVVAVDRAVRTEKHVHSTGNVMALTLSPTARWDEAAFVAELANGGGNHTGHGAGDDPGQVSERPRGALLRLLAPARRIPDGIFAGYMVPLRQVYHYAIEYEELFTPAERVMYVDGPVAAAATTATTMTTIHDERGQKGAATSGGDPCPRTLFLTPLPDDMTEQDLEDEVLAAATGQDMIKSGGGAQQAGPLAIKVAGVTLINSSTAEVEFETVAERDALVALLDGRRWKGKALIALPAGEARAKSLVHGRIRQAMSRIVALSRSSDASARRFVGVKSRARNANTRWPLSRCSSGISSDLRAPGKSDAGRGTFDWATRDLVVLRWAAKTFPTEMVRRLTGVVVKVVRGEEDESYIDQCFSGEGSEAPAAASRGSSGAGAGVRAGAGATTTAAAGELTQMEELALAEPRRMWLADCGFGAQTGAWCRERLAAETEAKVDVELAVVAAVRRCYGQPIIREEGESV